MQHVLFYIEPVVFRQNPNLLEPWARWVAQIAGANRASFATGLCSNIAICNIFVEALGGEASVFEISSRELLEEFNFDRHNYGRALYASTIPGSGRPSPRLLEIESAFHPDVVVSFTEAPALHNAFPNSTILFTEMGCLPRIGAPQIFFYDPCGHQTRSVLNERWEDVLQLRTPLSGPMAADIIRQRALKGETHPAQSTIRDWLDVQKRRGKIMLVALQPRDWITHEGLLGATRQEELIFELAATHRDYVVVPTYHALETLTPEMEAFIEHEAPNVAFPPRDVSAGLTELFIPHIDALTTVSSSIAILAALSGRFVNLLTKAAYVRAIETSNAYLCDAERHDALCARLLTFLSNKYMEPAGKFLSETGYFSRLIRNFSDRAPLRRPV